MQQITGLQVTGLNVKAFDIYSFSGLTGNKNSLNLVPGDLEVDLERVYLKTKVIKTNS